MSTEEEPNSGGSDASVAGSNPLGSVCDGFLEDLDKCQDGEKPLLISIPSSPILKQMYMEEAFHDVIFVIGEKKVSGNKATLASVSPVFKTMFTSGFKESEKTKEVSRIALSEIKASTLKRLLDLIYNGEVLVSKARAFLLLEAAHMYEMSHVLNSIADVLGRHVSLENYLEMWSYSSLYDIQQLQECIVDFVRANQIEVCSASNFGEAPTALVSLATVDITKEHNCSKVLMILQHIERWMLLDRHERREAMDSILRGSLQEMSCVRDRDGSVCRIGDIGEVLLRLSESSSIAIRFVSKILDYCVRVRGKDFVCTDLRIQPVCEKKKPE